MKRSVPRSSKTLCLALLIAFASGCGNSEPPPKPTVLSHKIVFKETVPPPPAATSALIAPAPAKIPSPSPMTTAPTPPGFSATLAPNLLPDPSSVLPPPFPLSPGGGTYDPTGKTDPFAPLFRETSAAVSGKGKRERREPITPIEQVDLSQLKLVGIIRTSQGNKAMVEESTGKGYILTKGTYIGNNSGSVTEILRDRIVVQEEIEDILGKITVQKRELKLPKPPGEE